MRGRTFKAAATLALPLILSGCVSATEYSAKGAGFTSVSLKTSEATGKQTVWVQNGQDAQAVKARVNALMSKKTIDVETAVQCGAAQQQGSSGRLCRSGRLRSRRMAVDHAHQPNGRYWPHRHRHAGT